MKTNEMLGGKALVHCMYGVSRSVSICVAYLMRYKELIGKNSKFGVDEAVGYIRVRRYFVGPNRGFMFQLRNYEEYLQGKRTSDEYEHGEELSDETKYEQEAAIKSIEQLTGLLKLRLQLSLK